MTFLTLIGMLAFVVLVMLWMLTQPILFPARRRSVRTVDIHRLETHVRMLSQTFHPRDDAHPENLNRAAAYIRGEMEAAKARASEQEYEWGDERYRNVIGTFGPEDGPRIVVGAHYDAIAGTPGADDNASGVAALLEVAHLLQGTSLAHRVDLVAYTLEEPPHFRTHEMGSAHHAALLREKGVDVRAMISLECIGYFSDRPGSQSYPMALLGWIYPPRGDFIAVVGRVSDISLVRRVKASMRSGSDLPVWSLNGPAFIPGVDFSDQLSYWAYEYPAVMVTNTAFYRNVGYHEANDTWDRLDYARLAKVAQGVYVAIVDLSR